MQFDREWLKEDLDRVEKSLRQHLTSEVPLVRQMSDYILASGGKRIRPILLLLCARLCGYEGESRYPLAAVIEFLHTATLLHDDVVDSATLRRGRISANIAWGNQAAVLVGDYLFARCFEMMVDFCDRRIMRVLAETTSLMAQGEVIQLMNSGDLMLDEGRYLRVVRSKTAALFSTTCRCAAILGQLDSDREKNLAAFGMHLGVAFQLVDDALDYIADPDESGKVVGRDLAEGKMTLPLIHALRYCDESERRMLQRIFVGKDPIEADLGFVQGLLSRYGSIDYTRRQADLSVRQACAQLEYFPDGTARKELVALARSAVRRRC
ncbi:polyprenyl synthetase family protein [Syntrophotalea acetylenica]|uniref:Octaprenyl diphosphate synthase n=1 Tax=Syntrophotalea acetylenica TaxID=29542 RepID=A0A1L3GCC9_SYNAC|nr:polyprenyl synthetase family protein [Syntrophotalea acetylenica]APG23593.1 octaprenyl diphosphate synthase [Syntrophotalea acetylenica]APG44170.1 octaprenyl diphosphate synthase [Syntrophotalea acetylenica]